ncbi:hypothetical protein [Micromonospora zhanjiangensis]|uniref:Lipoprotein n=1 Tax=Micromonospora zhanjiangensis TaxID=1522057 RepID=A0ABV8KF10_9ACTN
MSRSRTGAATLTLAVLTALVGGCGSADESGKPTTTDPSSSASATPGADAQASPRAAADNTDDVCTAAAVAIAEGSKKIVKQATDSIGKETGEATRNKQMQATFAAVADDIRAQAGKATDPGIGEILRKAATDVDKGAKAADPVTFLGTDFVRVPKDLQQTCHS